MSEPKDGERMSVKVILDVPVVYQRGDKSGPFRAGWVVAERVAVLGYEAEGRAILKAESEWALSEEPDPDLVWMLMPRRGTL
jgi:hypothetical protein